ncbi:MAG TPA: hypothetical protein PJ986_13770 [Gammaproteobacteria bacterium]|nr:hypothetical protein [Gammaproteobacteria bacterium]
MQIAATVLGSQTSSARATRAGSARVAAVAATPAVEGVVLRDEAVTARPLPADAVSRRAQPAAMLYAMFERMGGASTSVWKGMHVNLVV